MRALILIVSCVIVLAIVQASYLVVDAHASGPVIRVSDDAHQGAHRSHPHQTAQPQALKDTREHAKLTKPSPTTPPPRVVVTAGVPLSPGNHDVIDDNLLRQLCQRRPELSRCRTEYVVNGATGAGTVRKQDNKAPEKELKAETVADLSPSDGSVNDTIRQILELAIHRKSHQQTPRVYNQGAHHPNTTSSRTHTANQFIMELPRGKETTSEDISIPEVGLRRSHHREMGYLNYANRNIRLHRQGCSLDHDCGTGCCLESRNGRRMCRQGGIKSLGKRCSSSCMCIPDLQCWVSDNGARHKLRKSRKAYGRCRDPRNPNLGEGHFMTSGTRTY